MTGDFNQITLKYKKSLCWQIKNIFKVLWMECAHSRQKMLDDEDGADGFDTENQIDLATFYSIFIQFTCQSTHLMFVPIRKHIFEKMSTDHVRNNFFPQSNTFIGVY